MIGALVGAGIAAASSIYGGIKSSRAARKAQQIEGSNYASQSASNQSWYDRRYNEDATQRADAQRILTHTADAIRRSNRAAAGAAAVGGATEESVAATKAANAQALADATSRIATAGEARKDAVEQDYRERQAQLDAAHTQYGVGIENQRANNISQAAAGVAGAAMSAGSAYDLDLMQEKNGLK